MGERWSDALFDGQTEITVNDLDEEYKSYRNGGADRMPDRIQEPATLSRLLYGFMASYSATGEPKFLNAARAGIESQRNYLRMPQDDGETTLWAFGRRP